MEIYLRCKKVSQILKLNLQIYVESRSSVFGGTRVKSTQLLYRGDMLGQEC